MDVSLEVLLSTSIKRKRPCTGFCWLGQEKESVFLVDENRISEVNLRKGSVKKPLLKKSSIVTLATSANGAWLAALNVSGDLSLWSKDLDCLLTVPAIADISQLISFAQETSLKLYLYVSGDGNRILLATHTGCVYLWENTEDKSRPNPPKTRTLSGRWTKIEPHDSVVFPSTADKEATIHAMFVKSEVLGDCCLCAIVFYSESRLMMTFLSLRWLEGDQKYNSVSPFNIHWTHQDCSLNTIHPNCEPVKSRGALVTAFSKDGFIQALAINQKDPKATCVVFINTMTFVTVCGGLKGCSSKNQLIPSRYLRSYWVANMSWTSDSMFLACVLKRGSLLLLTRLGELMTLTTYGCSVEFGPAEFIPLHPLITYRPPVSILENHNGNDSLGSVASEADLMRQRFSVTCHPRLPYVIVSDGYMVTALRFSQNLSPYHFMKSLLLDAAQRLENVRQSLQPGKAKKNGIKLRSLSSLKATLLKDAEKPSSVHSTVPSFLQDEEELCNHLEKLLQDDDEESDDQEHLKYKAQSDSTFGRAEQGRLEFASMFDTIHASDHTMVKSDVLRELLLIRKILLTAWTTGVTMRNIADLDSLLQYTVGCFTHLLSLLQSPGCPPLQSDKRSKASGKSDTLCTSCIDVLQQCLFALHWDVAPRQALGHMIKLTVEVIKLILAQSGQLYSKNLVEGFCLLKMVSLNLAAIYGLHFEPVPADFSMNAAAQLDIVNTPVFEAVIQPLKGTSVCYVFKEPPNAMECRKSEKRLAVLWRLLYNQTLWYQTRLRKPMSLNQSMQSSPGVQSEEKAILSLLCHLQAELQCANQHLSQSLRLLPVTGEEYFLFGSYKESVEFWKRELLEASLQGGFRAGLLQTRYYLAILYCNLYHYNLNDAEGLCDQLVKELLLRSDLLADTENAGEDEPLLKKIDPEAALAVIQSMGRFMAAYFTNQLLYIFPPHNVCVLAPLHITIDRFPRVVTLQHSVVASAVRDQNLSSVWTVEYALDLLLIGGLIPEAAWLANKLGDWKMSVSMAVAYNLHLKGITDESKEKLPPMPLYLSPSHIFQEKLQSILGQPPHLEGTELKNIETKQFTDPIEEEDADVLFNSVQEMLKAAVMADAEILTKTLRQLMESAKELIGKLPGLVPERLYLPAPPLYCPQPSSVSEEDPSDLLLQMEKRNRQKLSGVLQRILLLLRAAHCSLPAAQWYVKQIKRARKIMQKIRAKGALPPLSPLPETLLNYANGRTVFLKPGTRGDLVSCSVVSCFRELCALCWMLHVRERLSLSCRKYQKARDSGKLFKSSEEYDSCVTEHCYEALEWACRMLPFSRVTNCEELIQDVILSLISELPPVKKVAEFMVKAFPHPDDVRVPLREKYHSVQQRLRHSMIKGLEGEEMMSVVTHNLQRVRIKALRRVQRNIGPMEVHVWEPPLDENTEDESHCYDRYSLGTSLSRSTLTDLGRIYSDTDTLSDTFITSAAEDRAEWHTPLNKPVHSGMPKREKTKERNEMPTENEPTIPKVGTWEFECDDEEYTNFLDLFLSYLLERDLLHSTEPGVPFLMSFAQHLRERELNSLAFDVHTTLKRKLGRPEIKSVFRAGSCYTVNAEPLNDSAVDGTLPPAQNTSEPSPVLYSTVLLGKPVSSAEKYFHKIRPPVKNGLFGLQDQKMQKCHEDDGNLTFSGYMFDRYSYSLIQNKHCTPSEELRAELQAKYSNEVKLVEWMIRWSDRRLFWSTGKAELCHVGFNPAIRVKTSSAAILTSVWLLEKPYLVPPRQYIVAPIVQHTVKSSLPREPEVESEDSLSERGPLSVVHEEDPELLEERVSRASSIESRVSRDRGPKRPYVAASQEKSMDDFSVQSECPTVDPIPVPSETEDDQPDTQRSPKISVSICPVATQAENVYSEAEDNVEDPEVSSEDEIPEQIHSDHTVSTGPPLPRPSPTVTNVPGPPAPSANMAESSSNGGQSTQPANTSDAVRQLFQDEMFRLLQLQQINFMSLMQVVGSSFAALPAIQQVLQNTAQMTGNLVANPTVGQAASVQLIPPASQNHTNLQTQRADKERALEIGRGEAETMPVGHSGNKENLQRPPEINIPSSQVNESEKIPASLGLLSTAPRPALPLITSTPPQQKSLNLQPPVGSSNFNGFPLLKLQTGPTLMSLNLLPGAQAKQSSRTTERPPLREAWGPSCSLEKEASGRSFSQPNQSPSYLSSSRIKANKKTTRWAQPVIQGHSKRSTGPLIKTHSSGNQPLRSKENKWRPEGSLLEVSQNNSGMPLLHLRTNPAFYLPSMPGPSFTVSVMPPNAETLSQPKSVPVAGFTLLKASLPQQIQNLQINPNPRLIPLQNLIAFEQDTAQKGESRSIQLLKSNIQPFEDVGNFGDSIKRQKRRSQKAKGEQKEKKKTSVRFRPEDSIITPNNFDEVVQNEKVLPDEPNLKEDNEFVIPLGTFESELTEQIPGPMFPTMAELHYLASLTKRPPEVQHASTNTDSAPSESHKPLVDKRTEELQSRRMATSTHDAGSGDDLMSMGHQQAPLNGLEGEPRSKDISDNDPLDLPPALYLNLPYTEQQGKMFQKRDTLPTHVGEHVLPTTDVDEEEYLSYFPGIEEKLPSSADLHLMAASEKNAFSAEILHNTDIIHNQPRMEEDQPVTIKNVIQPEKPSTFAEESISRIWTPRGLENIDAFNRLHAMDAQLRALQNMADSMERDFANTELLVNTIENLATAVDPHPKEVHFPRERTVAGNEPTLNEMVLEDLAEEEEFTLPIPRAVRLHEQPPEVLITRKPATHPLTDLRQDGKLVMEKSTVSEQLQMTGLSDIADILTDLMEGGVSASELGLTERQAQAISRQRLANTSKRSQKEKPQLRMWMKKKQKERLEEYRKKLEELREREHKPFQSQHHADNPVSSKILQQAQKLKNEKDRMLLSDHHSHRVSDAWSLMQEMLSDAHQITARGTKPSRPQTSLSRQRTAQPSSVGSRKMAHNLSTASRAGVLHPRSTSSPLQAQTRGTATFTLPKSASEPTIRPRNGPSYAVNRRYDPSLPGDRISQITRRGMLSRKNRANINNKTTKPSLKTTTKLLKSPRQDRNNKATSPQVQEEYDRDIVSPWELSEEMHRIIYGSQNSIISQGSIRNGDHHNANRDNASDSTGSILSKLDWKAIEDLVASVEST